MTRVSNLSIFIDLRKICFYIVEKFIFDWVGSLVRRPLTSKMYIAAKMVCEFGEAAVAIDCKARLSAFSWLAGSRENKNSNKQIFERHRA